MHPLLKPVTLAPARSRLEAAGELAMRDGIRWATTGFFAPLVRERRLPVPRHVAVAVATAALCFATLGGWALDLPLLASFLPQRPAMVPLSAFALLLAAMGVACLHRGRLARRIALLQICCGALVLVCLQRGAAAPVQTLFSCPSPLTAAGLLASAASTWLLASGRHWQGQTWAFANLLFTALIGIGHVFPVADLYQHLPRAGIAVPTVIAFVLLAIGQLLAFPDRGMVAALTSRNAAGRAGLRLILAGFVVPLLLCMALVFALHWRFFDGATAVMLMAWSAMALLGSMLWALAVTVDRATQAQAEAERRRNQIRHMVIAALTHDIRSPVQVATLSCEALLRMAPDGGDTRPILERLQRNHRRIDRLLRSLLDSLSIEDEQELVLRPSHFDLGELVHEVVDENDARLARRTRIHAEQAAGWWDRDALFRVVENILLNAVKYGVPAADIVCRVEKLPDERARLTVTNQGTPIPESEWESIFRPFSRGKGPQVALQPGWGVGLAYARTVVERHGGAIRVGSSGREGTCFEVTLPVAPAGERPPWRGPPAPLASHGHSVQGA